jgi:uncharacterized membrane protein
MQAEARAAAEPKVHWVDQLVRWIQRRSRTVRIILCALIALIFTAGFGLVLYGSLLNTDPRRLNFFGVINAQNLPFYVLILLCVAGMVFYWAGWRVMVGFDMGDEPLQPGRAAAVWVLAGLAMLVFVLFFGGLAAFNAIQQ